MSEQDNITNIPELDEGLTSLEESPAEPAKKSGKAEPTEKPKKVKAHRMTKAGYC